jgi:hypothetical protein
MIEFYQLWRVDDYGNAVLIEQFPRRAAAETRLDVLRARGHKQYYEIRRPGEKPPDFTGIDQR